MKNRTAPNLGKSDRTDTAYGDLSALISGTKGVIMPRKPLGRKKKLLNCELMIIEDPFAHLTTNRPRPAGKPISESRQAVTIRA